MGLLFYHLKLDSAKLIVISQLLLLVAIGYFDAIGSLDLKFSPMMANFKL